MTALDARTVTIGTELLPLVKGPITREDLKRYAAASGDPNPMHTDEEFARNAGYPGVFAHGMQVNILGQAATELLPGESQVGGLIKVRLQIVQPLPHLLPVQRRLVVERILKEERLVDIARETRRSANALCVAMRGILDQ